MTKLIFTSLLLLILFSSYADTWTQKASITGERDAVMSFSIGTKGYICGGYNSGTFTSYQDFWEWDQSTNVWTQKADFGGGFRSAGVGFSIGTKGYVGTGFAPALKKDFWEWDQVTNIWTQKADFGGLARWLAVGFSIGTKGYIATGDTNGFTTKVTQDMWEWDGDTASATYNTWIQKSSFPGPARYVATGFSIGTKGYIGTGSDGNLTLYNDFWEWDGDSSSITFDTWTPKTDFGGTPRQGATGFTIGTKGYIGTGADGGIKKDFWEWDQVTGLWTQKADFGGPHRRMATGFSIGNKGYIGMGFFFTVSTNDFWEYCDTCAGVGINEINNAANITVCTNPVNEKLQINIDNEYKYLKAELYNIVGEKVFEKDYQNVNKIIEIDVSKYKKGIYFLRLGVPSGKLNNGNDFHSFKLLVE